MALFRLSSMARSPPLLSVEAQESSAPAPGSAAGSRNLPPFFDDPFIKFDFHMTRQEFAGALASAQGVKKVNDQGNQGTADGKKGAGWNVMVKSKCFPKPFGFELI